MPRWLVCFSFLILKLLISTLNFAKSTLRAKLQKRPRITNASRWACDEPAAPVTTPDGLLVWWHFCAAAEMDPDDGLLTDYGLAAAAEASRRPHPLARG